MNMSNADRGDILDNLSPLQRMNLDRDRRVRTIAALVSAHKLCPPTSPHVELLRHRRYIKFKAAFCDLFRSCAPSIDSSRHQKSPTKSRGSNSQNQLESIICSVWQSMPPHRVWDRYQFSLKVLEATCVRETQRGRFPEWCCCENGKQLLKKLACSKVQEINHWINRGRTTGTVWEPLIPVPSIMSGDSMGTCLINQKYRERSMDLLREEIEFQFRRTLRRQRAGNNSGRRSKGVDCTKAAPLSIDKLYVMLGGKKSEAKKAKLEKNQSEGHKAGRPNGADKEEYILRTIFTSDQFQRLLKKLHKKSHKLADECYSAFLSDLSQLSQRLTTEEWGYCGQPEPKPKPKGWDIPKICPVNPWDGGRRNDAGSEQRTIRFEGVSIEISESHMHKLHTLYLRTLHNLLGRDCYEDTEYTQFFPKFLFCILLRYDALDGPGLQPAVPRGVFDFLHDRFSCELECFASPFNCWYEGLACKSHDRVSRYGSAFGDTDALFGSAGSFFGMDFLTKAEESGGCFQANPPFASALIEKMCDRMNDVLARSNGDDQEENEKKHIPLMFVIFVPSWAESSGWNALSSSTHLSRHLLLGQKDSPHKYVEGTHQQRGEKSMHRKVSFDTSVFFLQNNAAREKWPLVEEDESVLKAAFAANGSEMRAGKGTKRKHIPDDLFV